MMTNTFLFHYFISEYIRHYVLDNLLCSSWELLVLEGGLIRHTMLATPLILIQFCFYYFTSEDIKHYVLMNLLS